MNNLEWNPVSTIPQNVEIIMKLSNDRVVIGNLSSPDHFGDCFYENENMGIDHVGFDMHEGKENRDDSQGFFVFLKHEIVGWKEIPKEWLV